MYDEYLSVLAIVVGIIGTTAAILSILRMKLEDVIYTRTALGFDTSELSTLRQVYDARVGIGLVIISGLLQVFCELYQEITYKIFWMVGYMVVLLSAAYWIIMYIVYKNSEAELLDQMPEEIRNALVDSIIKKKCFIKGREVSKYKKLINGIKGKNSSLNFETVSRCIDEIISDKSENEKMKKIKSLVCYFEGISHKSNAYMILTICFALLIGIFSILLARQFNLELVCFISGDVIIMCIIAIGVLHRDYKEAFILKVLNFKLEELNNQRIDNKEIPESVRLNASVH